MNVIFKLSFSINGNSIDFLIWLKKITWHNFQVHILSCHRTDRYCDDAREISIYFFIQKGSMASTRHNSSLVQDFKYCWVYFCLFVVDLKAGGRKRLCFQAWSHKIFCLLASAKKGILSENSFLRNPNNNGSCLESVIKKVGNICKLRMQELENDDIRELLMGCRCSCFRSPWPSTSWKGQEHEQLFGFKIILPSSSSPFPSLENGVYVTHF